MTKKRPVAEQAATTLFAFASEKARKNYILTVPLLAILVVSAAAATQLVHQWLSRTSLDKQWWYRTKLRIDLAGEVHEETFQFLGTRVNRGIFVVETYVLQRWDHAQWTWVPASLPAGSHVEILSRIIMDRRGVRADIEGTHTEDRHRFIGSVTIRRDLLWFIVCAGSVASIWLTTLALRSSRRLRRFNRGLCPRCAYPLLQGELVTCPECGLRILREPPAHTTPPIGAQTPAQTFHVEHWRRR